MRLRLARMARPVVLLCLVCGLFPDGAYAETDPRFSGLADRWRQAMVDLHVPGLAVVVVQGDQIVLLETLGTRSVPSGAPVTSDTQFYIASLTKPFVAMATLALAQNGTVQLDAPVRRYLPWLELADGNLADTITVADLLSHRYGLQSDPIIYLDAYTGEITEDRFRELLKSAEITGKTTYTNLHYTLLGRVIESATGQSWKQVVHEQVLGPLGMARTTSNADAVYMKADGDVAMPSEFRNGEIAPAGVLKSDKLMHAAGGIIASISDLARWMQCLLRRESCGATGILAPEQHSGMTTVRSTFEKSSLPPPFRWVRQGMGYGWNISDYQGHTILEHGGNYVGFSSFAALVPERGIGVAVLANANSAIHFLAIMDALDRVLGTSHDDLLPVFAQRTAAQTAKEQSRRDRLDSLGAPGPQGLSRSMGDYSGVYTNGLWGTVVIAVDNGRLTARTGEMDLQLGSTGTDVFEFMSQFNSPAEGEFVVEDQRVVTVRLKLNGDQWVAFDHQ